MISLAPSRATSSRTSARSRPEPNNASISARIFSVGDTRDGTGVVLPVQTLAVLYGTYARRHLHRWMDTARTDPRLATLRRRRIRPEGVGRPTPEQRPPRNRRPQPNTPARERYVDDHR